MSMISCSGCCGILNILLYDALWYYKKNIEIKKINDAEESSRDEGRMAFRSFSRKVRRHRGSREGAS